MSVTRQLFRLVAMIPDSIAGTHPDLRKNTGPPPRQLVFDQCRFTIASLRSNEGFRWGSVLLKHRPEVGLDAARQRLQVITALEAGHDPPLGARRRQLYHFARDPGVIVLDQV